MEVGPVKDDRPWIVDEKTLSQVIELGNRPNKGLKARYTHPNMSNDGLSHMLGHWKDLRFNEGRTAAIGDLYISRAAFNSPSGDLGTHALDLAEDHNEDFGVSIAVKELDEESLKSLEDGEKRSLRLRALRAADLVDEPAASTGLFSEFNQPQALPQLVTWILDNHFEGAEPEVVLSRFCGLLTKYYGEEVAVSTPNPAPSPVATPDGKRYVALFGDRGAVWFVEGKSLEDCFGLKCQELEEVIKSKDDALSEKDKTIEELQAKVKDLEQLGEPVPVPTGVSPDPNQPAKPKDLSEMINIVSN